MELHQIKYFLAVCEALNFTRAATQCNVTQPALTRAIQKLEEELGGLLFRRERNLTHLTDLGRMMRPHLENVMAEMEAVRSTAESFRKLDKAPLNIGVMCTVGPLRFIGFLAEFRRRSPGIELSLKEGPPSNLLDMLTSGDLDLALLARPEPFPERLDVQPIYRERYVVAFPVGHRFQEREAVRLGEIEGEEMLSRANCEYHDHVAGICRQRGIHPRLVFASEREDWIQSMCAAGLGLCLIWESSPILPGVMTRKVVEPELEREISLVSVAGRRFSPAAMSFVRAARSHSWRP